MICWKMHVDSLLRWGQTGHRLFIMRGSSMELTFSLVKPFTMQSFDHGHFVQPDDATLDDGKYATEPMAYHDVAGFLQAAADAAWEAGIYPKQLQDHSSELKAVRGHLEDMRKLAGVK